MKKLITLVVLLFATTFYCSAQSNVKELTYDALENLLSDDDDRMLEGETPIIIDFSATWCGPCKQFAPFYNELSGLYKGEIDFYKVDVDKERELSEAFEIKSVPTIILIPVAGEVKKFVGVPDADELYDALEALQE